MSIVDWIYPKRCVGCRKEEEYICEDCRKKLILPEQICPMCCKPSLDGWAHPRCQTRTGIDRLIVSLPYKGLVQNCLKKVKYKSNFDILDFLFRISNFANIKEEIIVPVPMWYKKERKRGFNQANIIARIIADKNKVRNLVLLKRVHETKPMFGLKKFERWQNIKNAFEIDKEIEFGQISRGKALLVDDVWTTGATMRECTKVLKNNGFREVTALTLAR